METSSTLAQLAPQCVVGIDMVMLMLKDGQGFRHDNVEYEQPVIRCIERPVAVLLPCARLWEP